MYSSRKSGGFKHKQSNGNEDGTIWNVHDNGNKPKLSFKMKNHAQNKEKDKARNLGLAIRGILNENLLMSVETDKDCREVAILPDKDNGNRCRWKNFIANKRENRLHLYKPSIITSGSRQNQTINPSCGYKISIPFGDRFKKEFVLNSLHNLIAPETFVPIMYKIGDHFSSFYVDDKRISEMLQKCDKQITGDDGFYLRIRIAQGFPRYELDQTLKDKMADAIAKKYVPEKNALDMSRFHHNPDLVDEYYCSLTRTPILTTALKIVTNVLSNLVEISLDNNQLHSLEKLEMLSKLPALKILGICDNKINDMDQLNAIKCLKLEELRLAGNPVCQKYNGRQDEYISDIRNKFPDLMRLDGVVLRAAIGFDLENDRITLPPAQRLFSPNAQVQEIAIIFLQEYYRIFDSDNRQSLLNAYDENASFSMTVSAFTGGNKLGNWLINSRNLCKISDEARRRKLLKQGRLPVVAFISELPRMQHDLNSFTMDIGLVTEKMMIVTVTGIFKEIKQYTQPIRAFSRTFTIIPKGEGYCIVNEMFLITEPTKMQVQAFQSSPSTTTTSTTTTSPTASTETMMTEDLRMQMTVALRERTNMNLEWTVKCLNDVNWNFDNALVAFQDCQNRGAIPPEAFEN